MRRLGSILLWSAISAAFIGPGTVTVCALSGARHGVSLIWALVFSTAACLALQEGAARLTVASTVPLGTAIRQRFGRGPSWAVVGAVVLGCAAYEAGNLLGAVAGLGLLLRFNGRVLALGAGALAAAVLLAGRAERVARVVGLAVAVMGAAFLVHAVQLAPAPAAVLRGAVVPALPAGAGVLVLGLVGTTVVPYNLFLGSGLARGQSLRDVRWGLAVAVPLGGLVSVAILVAGTSLSGRFSFAALGADLDTRLGGWAAPLFAIGLAAAGLSSAVTAPLAAGLALRSVGPDRPAALRLTALAVLGVGVGFAVARVQPVPAIVLAQAANGILLPAVALFLLLATNDRALMGPDHLNGWRANVAMGIATAVALVLGLGALLRAGARGLGLGAPSAGLVLGLSGATALGLAVPTVLWIRRRRHHDEGGREGAASSDQS